MKVLLHVQDGGKTFTSLQSVQGVMRLELANSTAISTIVLSLKGRLRTFIIGKGFENSFASVLPTDNYEGANDCHKVFKVTKVLFPECGTSDRSRDYTLAKGTYSFPFELSFPSISACDESQPDVRHLKAALPPSLDAHASDHRGVAKIDYLLRVKVKRPGRFQRDKISQQKLAFLPSDPPLSLMSYGSGYSTASRSLYVGELVSSRRLSASPLPSARHTPILMLEARLPSPAVLYPEEKVPLHLFVRTFPILVKDLLPIELRSLAVGLRNTITVTIGVRRTAWTSYRDLLRLTGLEGPVTGSRGAEELSEIAGSILQNFTIPKITPSFTTCTVQQDYFLEVTAGFSLGGATKLQLLKTVINVEIHSGIGRETHTARPENPGCCDIPLRVGCLEHLAASQRMLEDNLPPPYT